MTAIVDAAHERAARFAAELRDEEQAFREAAVRDSEQLEQSLQRAAERKHQPEQPQETTKTSRDANPSWADDDLSEHTWLEDVDE
ncbi:hypothetical protein [Saccharopolyspora phatthalungensis]|uniref:Uncharacterized protein n=1 Tax=Saccharopolyspora phatthalungensis TaxID=664693 RepID=A0A840Q9X4_9PSEU|nr:hypothetical protein [Saccharopolyspora phatthalungensis]MBB5155458.1 hypothetical protein [Saccharopolyspora phatthalungensis]